MPLKLINAKPSPFGRKVAIALEEKGVPYEVQYDLPWSAGSCTSEYSPLSQLPILISETEGSIYDSSYILEWLEARYPEPALLPKDVEQRLEARKRQMLGERLQDFGGTVMFENSREHPGQSWLERHTQKVFGALRELERLYSAGKSNALEVDLGDIAVVSTLDLFEFATSAEGVVVGIDALHWRDIYPALTRLSKEMNERPSFQKTRPRPMDIDMREVTA